jgi:hypothetical protein
MYCTSLPQKDVSYITQKDVSCMPAVSVPSFVFETCGVPFLAYGVSNNDLDT